MDRKGKIWNEAEDNHIIRFYKIVEVKKLAEYLHGRSYASIRQRITKLRNEGKMESVKCNLWEKKDEQFILDNYDTMSPGELAEGLNMDRKKIYSKCKYLRNMGILSDKPQHKNYKKANKKSRGIKKEKKLDKKYNDKVKESLELEKKNRNYGIGKKQLDFKFEKNKDYELEIYGGDWPHPKKFKRIFKGQLVQATHDHITFIKKNGIRESFLRNDFLIREVRTKGA